MDIKLTSSGDIAIEQGDLVLVDGAAEAAQRISLALSVQFGEWFLDINQGIDWFNILNQYGNQDIIDAKIKTTVLADPEVSRIDVYNTEVINNKLFVNIIAVSIYNEELGISVEI